MKIYLLKNFLSVLFQVLPRGWRNYRSNSDRNWRHKNPKMFRHSDSVILFMEPRNRFRQAGNWFLGSLKGLKIWALNLRSFLFIYLFLWVNSPPPPHLNETDDIKTQKCSVIATRTQAIGRQATGRQAKGRQATGWQATGRQTAERQADGRKTGRQATGRQATGGSRMNIPDHISESL